MWHHARVRAPDEGAHMNLGRRRLRLAAVAGMAAVALTAAGCGSSGSRTPGNTNGGVSLNNRLPGINPGTGTPKQGGTPKFRGPRDIDFMDYNISYHTPGHQGPRVWVRG